MEKRARRVRVSASTSNLGPGFDLAGLALDLFLEVELSARDRPEDPALVLGAGCEEWPRGAHNRLWRAFESAARRRGVDPRMHALRARSEIPVGRGFGSSGAATVAGVLLAEALAPARDAARGDSERAAREPAFDAPRAAPERLALLEECIALEGHPDNATPALCGGFTLSFLAAGRAVVVESELAPSLGFAIAWPDAPLDTARARALLPERVVFADAVENPRRLAALLAGLRDGDPRLIAVGAEDRLHERYRLPAIRGAREALDEARAAGAYAALVSGSGSGTFAVCARGEEPRIAAALVRGFERGGARAQGRPARVVREAPEVVLG